MVVPNNFCGIPEEFSDYSKAKVAIISVPYEGTVSYGKGTSKGPEAIIEASKNMETYDEELKWNAAEVGIATLPEIKARQDPEEVVKQVRESVLKVLNDEKFPVVLGGEHSISTGFALAVKEKYPEFSVLQLDAHADLREEFEGTKYSHAAVMKRIHDINPSTVQVGIRSLSEEEGEFIDREKKKIFWAKDTYDNDSWMKDALKLLKNDVFITFDIDVFDPSIVPATGTPEPGGLSWYTVVKFLRMVFEQKNVIGFDLVELAPTKNSHPSDFLASKLVYKMIGYRFKK
ncbi:agmatinase [Candidatus Woesearchaeota archaeon]|nr:agmatinase [Candidatus Woesearchaeota archaeon]